LGRKKKKKAISENLDEIKMPQPMYIP